VKEQPTQSSSLLIEIKAFAEKYADDQLTPYIDHVKKPYVSFGAKEINDALWGTIRLSPLEAAILDSPFLQRLRSIRQLGVVHWVYPGAVHTRFEHTLGVLSRTQELLAALDRSISEEGANHRVDPSLASILRLSSLLHDVGHGVFSHVSESALDRLNEIRTALIEFANSNRPANPKLSELFAAFLVDSPAFRALLDVLIGRLGHPIKPAENARQTADQIAGGIRKAILGQPIDSEIPLLHELISGPFDADKLDYFVRDSRLAGIPSVLDISRLIQKITVRPVTQRDLPRTIASQVQGGRTTYLLFGLKWSGAAMLDELHLARILLFAKIYRHHKVLAIEAMIEGLFGALATIVKPIDLIRFSYSLTDEQFLFASVDQVLTSLRLTDVDESLKLFVMNTLERLRLRQLYARGFVIQSPFPGDPWGEDTEQQRGLRRLVEDIEHPTHVVRFRHLVIEEIKKICALVPEAIAEGFPQDSIQYSLIISAKPRLSGGTQIDRALVFHGSRIVPYKDLTVNRVAWADAYNFSSASAHIFCPREISEACFIATEKIIRAEYDVITPLSAIELSKQNPETLTNLKHTLDKNGFYSGAAYDIRPVPRRLEMADVDGFLDDMTKKFSSIDEPAIDEPGRRPAAFRGRLAAWLSQFRDDSHVECAMHLIRELKILRREDTKSALLSFLEKNPQFRGATICLLGTLKDSSAIQSYFSLDLRDEFSGLMTVEDAAHRRIQKPIVFLDDVLGSGGQAKNMLGHWFDADGLKSSELNEQRNLFGEVERAYLRERSVGFVFVAGWDEGVRVLRESCGKVGLEPTIHTHLSESEIPFAFERPFPGKGAEEVQSFRARCLEIGKKILISKGATEEKAKERALGYGNRGMLLVSGYNVPTQVLTCLWQEGLYDGVHWQALLRRRKKE
jgi:HD superfamily phosphohydrolase